MAGRYIRCEECSRTFSINKSWSFDSMLLEKAREAGWSCDPLGKENRRDFCPEHARAIIKAMEERT
jgi:hypothetical protein